ncbi:glycosyltransferase family 2 protein [Siphonobacter sp. SORGH_AS_0500]|uniref:glycosyltransferase family 2 protein n=1 Tax=Siphonobacter sp. SORGH_AS_0500 TaxID=1864824 RepID=UPI002863C255|nr:glycosyltransferase family 2 protein [Siphonobacter sp. SORGH_AS_0500]MDR6193706.1 glycosyltransferase involved in cell wall biosynthesis [Siphonobacter sp. SORGH_AS_0500]
MSHPKITIVTVVYNAVETIEATISSVLSQTYRNIEYIIIDGESSDGTLEIIKKYSNELSLWVSEKDKGIYDAMNKALGMATGDWLLFLGADDLLYSTNTIENISGKFKSGGILYYGNTYLKQSNIKYNGKTNKWRLAYGNISHQAIFYPKNMYKNNLYDLNYPIFADHVYNIKLYGLYADKFSYIEDIISIYNEQGVSSTNNDKHYAEEINSIINKHLGMSVNLYAQCRRMMASFLR